MGFYSHITDIPKYGYSRTASGQVLQMEYLGGSRAELNSLGVNFDFGDILFQTFSVVKKELGA